MKFSNLRISACLANTIFKQSIFYLLYTVSFLCFLNYITPDDGLTVKPKLVTCYVTLFFMNDIIEYKHTACCVIVKLDLAC